ncbi:serine hydrolase domain-containing protein [Pseudarthrobacter sp. DSP2-3-2b1]|uniref:serine hydrolase domain-containing protein n=1 Tax=Pseudarthrobacter sp. DSP2-3-2b1 TaxID=2804661 RepID=UPI003CF5FF65
MRSFLDQGAVAVVTEVRWPGGTWSRAYGVRSLESPEPATPADRVSVASITKSMTAVSVMKMVEDGLIRLDDPVNGFIDSFTTVLKPPAPITVRQLLGHTSGMGTFQEVTERNAEDIPRIVSEDLSTQRVLELTAQLPWEAMDVGHFKYSDSGYFALGQLIETLRGRPYTEVLREDVIDRLGVKSTSIDQPVADTPDMIHGYITLKGERLDITQLPGDIGSPAFGAISSVPDVNSFYAALFRGELLSDASLQEMFRTDHLPMFGLGLIKWAPGCDGEFRYGGRGGIWAYRTAAMASTDGQYQATMTLVPPPLPTPLEDRATEDKLTLWDGHIASALQETLDRLCPKQ